MDREQMRQRLMQTFLEELQDHAQRLTHALTQLKKISEPAQRSHLLRDIFRAAHSLKGDARAVGVPLLESVCHEIEAVLAAIQQTPERLSPAFLALLFDFVDALQQTGERLRAGAALEGSLLAALLPRLQSGPGTSAPAPRPTAVPTAAIADAEPAEHTPAESSVLSASVRLPAQKLDALQQGVAELGSARTRPQARREHLEAIRDLTRSLRDDLFALQVRRSDAASAAAKRHEAARDAASRKPLRTGFAQLEKELEELYQSLVADELFVNKAVSTLQHEVQNARLVPLGEVTTGFERVVDDLAQRCGKEVQLRLEGMKLEIDRFLVQHLKEPLLHLVRNAVDHGIELPHERQQHGKPAAGTVTCSARLHGNRVLVEVVDDGRGIDWNAIREQARHQGVPGADQFDPIELIFRYGLTTKAHVTEVSGRGVGLDVVRARVEALRGEVTVTSQRDVGTQFTLSVPLDVSARSVLLVRVAGQLMALDQAHVVQLARLRPEDRRQLGGRPGLAWQDDLLPLDDLAELLEFPATETVASAVADPVVIVGVGNRRAAFLVTALQGSEDVTVQALGPRLRTLRFVQGVFTLPNGQVVLLLDVPQLLSETGRKPTAGPAATAPEASRQRLKRLLVADDSLTTRTLEKTILEAAGYHVLTAVDGQQAWNILQEQGADLLITDVEMPVLDGFQLTEAIRNSKRFRDLPIILLTARHTDQDQQRGLEAGADAYLIKSAFDQRSLLATISQLV